MPVASRSWHGGMCLSWHAAEGSGYLHAAQAAEEWAQRRKRAWAAQAAQALAEEVTLFFCIYGIA